MATNFSTKVVITHRGALQRKHGVAGVKKKLAAIRRLAKADAKRGIVLRLIAIDRAQDMQPFGRTVSKARDARQVKRAIDDIYRTLRPEYIMILGAPDVIPHVRLKNPLAVSRDDDRRIESDLPYACDAPYSSRIRDFLGPSRVVGRLPDITGRRDPDYLVSLLDMAAIWKGRKRSDYENFFSLSAQAWKVSTRMTTRKLFGTRKSVRLSPVEGPLWTAGDIKGRIHLINCHGDTGAAEYFGQNENNDDDQPSAYLSRSLRGMVQPATIVAAECCYGAELYRPKLDAPLPICQTYLGEGAWAFFGSTTVTWGETESNNFADLICKTFLGEVLTGASVGRAALEARQRYIRLGGYMEMIDLKTIAQFLLLGDPSIHPVKGAGAARAGGAKIRAGNRLAHAAMERGTRRARLARKGVELSLTTAAVAARADTKPSARMRRELAKLATMRQARSQKIASFKLHATKERNPSTLGRRLIEHGAVFHVVTLVHALPSSMRRSKVSNKRSARSQRLLVVREERGKIRKVVEAVRHQHPLKGHG